MGWVCAHFMRTMFNPASRSLVSISTDLVFGPMVPIMEHCRQQPTNARLTQEMQSTNSCRGAVCAARTHLARGLRLRVDVKGAVVAQDSLLLLAHALEAWLGHGYDVGACEEPVKRGPLRKGATKPSTPAGRSASCLAARGATVGRARRRRTEQR